MVARPFKVFSIGPPVEGPAGVYTFRHHQPAIQGLHPLLLSAATRQMRQIGNKCDNDHVEYVEGFRPHTFL
jgi:hypothetical protein